ncbi:EamA family transporter [Spiractinospora alimapuensis]|uniref:EamA family transporter n=1 Tax=Spiractinospora alimapuensis TaxID=2820884 RepID=UPI001F1A171D|nr:EamA family transporter [Spiractinospora alimapuensis]QVQ52569.1 EamA family transporter [Spiractinospora alimapuensis]
MREVRRHRATGLAFALVSALAFGGSGPFARPLLDAGMDSLHVTWLRVAAAALVLAPFAIAHRSTLRSHPALLLAYGVFPMAGVQAFYFAAISRIPVGVALLIEFLGPILVLAWVRFVRRQRVPRSATIGVILAIAGLSLLLEVHAGLTLDPLGIALALGAAGCQMGYFLLSDAAGDEVHPLAVISFGALIGTLLLTPLAQPWSISWTILADTATLGGVTVPAWVCVAWIALVSTAVAYLTGVAAVRRLSPQVAGGVAYMEVVTAIVLAWVMLAERLTPAQAVGAVVVVAGAFVAQRAVDQPSVAAEPERSPGEVSTPR